MGLDDLMKIIIHPPATPRPLWFSLDSIPERSRGRAVISLFLTRRACGRPWPLEPGLPTTPVSQGRPPPPQGGSPHVQEADVRSCSFVSSILVSGGPLAAESGVLSSFLLLGPGSAGAPRRGTGKAAAGVAESQTPYELL